MRESWQKKSIVFGIILILFCSAVIPGISSKTNDQENIIKVVENPSQNKDIAFLTFYIIDENGKKQNKVDLPIEEINDINNIFEKLKNSYSYDQQSDKTQELKNDLIELLDENGLISGDIKETDIHSLLHQQKEKFMEYAFKTSFLGKIIMNLLSKIQSRGGSGGAFICSVTSGGEGFSMPFNMLLPRTRPIVIWLAGNSYTSISALMRDTGLIAGGNQYGYAIGFKGVGLTYSIAGITFYGFLGNAIYSWVSADSIIYFPINYPPTVSAVSPVNNAQNVPISTNELRFRMEDPNGDLMSYTVTTNPNIGEGQGIAKPEGTYTIPISGLEGSATYTWTVEVTDGKYETIEVFTFTTELDKPIVSDPSPEDDDTWVPIDTSQLSFKLRDPQGDLMDYTVETAPDIGSGSANGVGEGTYYVDVSGLDHTTDYNWYVNVTDGEHSTYETFNFKTQPIMTFDPFDEGWTYRKKITIDHNLVAGSLTDFPVQISVIDNDLKNKAQNDGDDILFMDGSGTADRLFHEFEKYDGNTGELVTWVNVPNLLGNADTDLYMYYGNSGCSNQQYPDEVYDSDYIHIWHLGDNLKDSAGSNDGSDHGTNIVSGKVGSARDFEQNEGDYISFGDMAQPADGSLITMTWEAWVKPESQDIYLMTKYDSSGEDYSSYALRFKYDGKFKFQANSKFGENGRTSGITEESYADVGEWIYLTATYNLGTIKDLNAFINGDEVAFNQEYSNGNVMWNTPATDDLGRIRIEAGPQYTDGIIDEVRWSKIVRSNDWIKTSYNTMNDPSSFFSVGPEET